MSDENRINNRWCQVYVVQMWPIPTTRRKRGLQILDENFRLLLKKLLFKHYKSRSDCQAVLMILVKGQLIMHLLTCTYFHVFSLHLKARL